MSHLCFGSYATIIRKYYLGTDKDVVDDLFSSIKEGTDIDKSKVSLLINSKDNVQGYIIETSQSQRVLTSIGDYFSDYIIPNLKSKNISILIQDLQQLISGDIDLPNDTKFKLMKYENNLPYFLSQIFLFAILQENKWDNPLENLGPIELNKIPVFNKTVRDFDFENVFIEVPQEKDLGLMNNNQIKTFHLLVENKRFSLTGLNDFVKKNIGRYLYSRLQIDEFYSNQAEETIFSEAISVLKSKGYTTDQLDNELGNIVIYIFLEHILDAPKIYTSVECADNVVNKTGLHLFKLNSQNLSFQMIFSKAFINDDLQKSINMAFQDLILIANSTAKHYKLLETSILGEKFDDATSNELKTIIIPQKRKNDVNVDKAYGILLGYSIDLDKAVYNEEYRKNLDKKMVDDLQNQIPYIVNKINESGLQDSSFYIYLLPLDDASKDKHTIMQSLIGGDS